MGPRRESPTHNMSLGVSPVSPLMVSSGMPRWGLRAVQMEITVEQLLEGPVFPFMVSSVEPCDLDRAPFDEPFEESSRGIGILDASGESDKFNVRCRTG